MDAAKRELEELEARKRELEAQLASGAFSTQAGQKRPRNEQSRPAKKPRKARGNSKSGNVIPASLVEMVPSQYHSAWKVGESSEAIEKWIEERRRKWPTQRRIEEKRSDSTLRRERGEPPRSDEKWIPKDTPKPSVTGLVADYGSSDDEEEQVPPPPPPPPPKSIPDSSSKAEQPITVPENPKPTHQKRSNNKRSSSKPQRQRREKPTPLPEVPKPLVEKIDPNESAEERRARLKRDLEARREARRRLKEQRMERSKKSDDSSSKSHRAPSLLAALMKPQVARETSVILQCIHHLVQSGKADN